MGKKIGNVVINSYALSTDFQVLNTGSNAAYISSW